MTSTALRLLAASFAAGLAACSSAPTLGPGSDASTPGADAATPPDSSAALPDAAASYDAATAGPDASAADAGFAPIPLRYLSFNVGNASPQFGCWEYKLCRAQDVQHLRDYISLWKPDVVLLTEVQRGDQLTGASDNGPILPQGWDGVCGQSVDRNTGLPAAFDAADASHEHECLAWKTSRVSLVPGSTESAYGRNDDFGKANCGYDFTGLRARLRVDDRVEVTAVIVHPDAKNSDCRLEEIFRYWSLLAQGERVIIGGDWNTESDPDIAMPAGFVINYSKGRHWNLAFHPDEYSAWYLDGGLKKQLDHLFSSFGAPCVDCGGVYHTFDLMFASALGGYDDHPRADQGDGMDHRQVLVDLYIEQ
jgi:hypothetical protein